MYQNYVYTAWRGDSLAVLIDSDINIIKLNPYLHNLNNCEEKNLILKEKNVKIQEINGIYRINGMLNLTRSIGDANYFTIQKTDFSKTKYQGS